MGSSCAGEYLQDGLRSSKEINPSLDVWLRCEPRLDVILRVGAGTSPLDPSASCNLLSESCDAGLFHLLRPSKSPRMTIAIKRIIPIIILDIFAASDFFSSGDLSDKSPGDEVGVLGPLGAIGAAVILPGDFMDEVEVVVTSGEVVIVASINWKR